VRRRGVTSLRRADVLDGKSLSDDVDEVGLAKIIDNKLKAAP
jgi:hypothetical protein